jgi:hypothetical protein
MLSSVPDAGRTGTRNRHWNRHLTYHRTLTAYQTPAAFAATCARFDAVSVRR